MDARQTQHEVILALFRQRGEATLADVDPRACRADRYRPHRLAQSALEAVPRFAVWFLGLPGGWERAVGFSQSPEFESVVRDRASLIGAAGRFFAGLIPADVRETLGGVLTLDLALAEVLRPIPPAAADPLPTGWVQLAPSARVLQTPPSAAAAHGKAAAALRSAEGGTAWERIWASAAGLPPDPPSEMVEHTLVLRGIDGDATAERLEPALADLLAFIGSGRPWPEVIAHLAADLDPAEASGLLDSLRDDAILAGGPSP